MTLSFSGVLAVGGLLLILAAQFADVRVMPDVSPLYGALMVQDSIWRLPRLLGAVPFLLWHVRVTRSATMLGALPSPGAPMRNLLLAIVLLGGWMLTGPHRVMSYATFVPLWACFLFYIELDRTSLAVARTSGSSGVVEVVWAIAFVGSGVCGLLADGYVFLGLFPGLLLAVGAAALNVVAAFAGARMVWCTQRGLDRRQDAIQQSVAGGAAFA